LKNKDDSLEAFKTFCKKVQNEKNSSIIYLRSDHEGEFENSSFKSFFEENGGSLTIFLVQELLNKMV